MSEREEIQPEERVESSEAVESAESAERVEEQALQDATSEPGARIEETQTFEQSEAVEEALKESMETAGREGDAMPSEVEVVPTATDDGSEIVKDDPGPGGSVAEVDEPGDPPPPPDAEGRVAQAEQSEQVIQEADALPATDLSPWVDGDVAEDPDHGPDPIERSAEIPDAGVGTFATEEPEPGGAPQTTESRIAPSPAPGGDVAEDPDHGPNPLERSAEIPDAGVGTFVTEEPEPGGASQTPESRIAPSPDPGGDVVEDPDHGPNPIGRSAETPETGIGTFITDDPEPGADAFAQTLEEGMLVTEEGEFVVTGAEVGVMAEALEGEPGAEAEETAEEEGLQEGDEGSEEGPKWYLHEDEDGNITVVDENGKPVDSPPNIVKFNGKYYAVYPGDELPIKEDGTIDDPQKLAKYELTQYKGSTEGMYLHEDGDGNITVVDENGKQVDSPPKVVYHQGKYYAVYPGENPFNEDGSIKDPSKVVELPNYKASTEGMYLHEDGEGNITVVDENGKPVDSPPKVIYHQGKYYAVYPGEDPFNQDGSIKDPGGLVELPNYQASTEGMYLHEDGEGNITVVDENGKPVDSPPKVIYHQGKYYAVNPGEDPFNKDGSIKDPGKLVELPNYKGTTEGMYLHEDGEGNVTVVDENGKPVDSPPKVIYHQGKYYAVNPGEDPFNQDGSIKDPGKLVELPGYKASTEDMYLHEDGEGNLTVVDENGKPVDSPPKVISYQGKYYAFYPGEDPFNPDGSVKDPSKLVELPNYKPSWWSKKAAQA